MAPGEHDLDAILASLTVARRPGVFAYVVLPEPGDPPPDAVAVIREPEGTTVVVESAVAIDRGWDVLYEVAWLTLEVHSALDSVGLTATVSTALAAAAIPCNVIAGAHHDHLLVPVDAADRALDVLAALRT